MPSFKAVLADAMGCRLTDFGPDLRRFLWTAPGSRASIVEEACRRMGVEDWKSVLERLRVHDWTPVLFDDVMPALDRLKSSFRMGLLSNTSVWTARDHLELGMGSFVEFSVLSCKVGLAKPDLRIFELAQDIAGAKPSELTYVGDSVSYDIEPALKMGWRAVRVCRSDCEPMDTVPVVRSLLELAELLGE